MPLAPRTLRAGAPGSAPAPALPTQPAATPAGPGAPVTARVAPARPAAPGGGVRSCTTAADTLTIRLAGEVDRHSAAPLRVVLTVAAVYGYRGLVLDATAVTFCDSALLDVVAWWQRDRRRLRLVPSRAVDRLLRAARAAGAAPVITPHRPEAPHRSR
ncbi:STAS domain-containing protein [Streptomyces sp. DH12]|uniref:STAS domain-containing protein n=1 Tax=Streptomyces sp. DH12 TaxID=2857010 RepID=UPI001E2D8A58|nr:STAS domain-containing protein [Streptomyces sp. DH12]